MTMLVDFIISLFCFIAVVLAGGFAYYAGITVFLAINWNRWRNCRTVEDVQRIVGQARLWPVILFRKIFG